MSSQKSSQPPLRQPLGFWTARAAEVIRNRTRGALAEAGLSQPEWWVLHQLSLKVDGTARSIVVDTVGPNETPEVIEDAIDAGVRKGWISARGAELRLTAAGQAVFDRGARTQAALQSERMQGVSDDDFVTTIVVLQRVIENLGGNAWHW